MDNELKILLVSALLHDIGKFAQRAKRPHSREMSGEYLTDYKGKPGHWHTLYTDYFIEKDLPLPGDLEKSRSLIARIASAHHRPDENSLPEMCISIADRLSSGADRIKDESSASATGFRESRLVSVFDQIELANHRFQSPGQWFHELTPLQSDNDAIFPKSGEPRGRPEDYQTLFDQFIDTLGILERSSDRFFIDGLISILEKFTWCIPSSAYKTTPDISLFDHAVSTAGIAQALYLFHRDAGAAPRWSDEDQKFILMGGDLSGIQNYIFRISKTGGKGVSKIFRARSFYLQALTASVLIAIRQRLGVHRVCGLTESGGKFILLLPNIPAVREKLNHLDEKLQWWMRNEFKGILTMNLTWNTCPRQQDLFLDAFQAQIEALAQSLEEAKLRKLHKTFVSGPVIAHDYDKMEMAACRLCEINAADRVSSGQYREQENVSDDDPAAALCRNCSEQIIYIGAQLPKADYIIYGPDEKVALFDDLRFSLKTQAPASLENVVDAEALTDDTGFSRVRLARYLPSITADELDDPLFSLGADTATERIYAGQAKTFAMLAHQSKRNRDNKLVGRGLLGFLKADVDNLGLIFSLGLGKRLSVARFASISRMLNFFFSDYLVKLAETRFPDLYVVFAGGDDLFVLGPWRQTIRFALTLRKQMSRFCAQNPDITLSAGILTAKPRFPMRKAVESVEEQLEKAKTGQHPGRIKDSVCFLDEVLAWDELDQLIQRGQRFDQALNEKERTHFTTAFMYRLLNYHRMHRAFRAGQIKAGRYLALAHYDIGRNIAARNNQEELAMLYKIFSVGDKERLELRQLHIPLFYAINANRD